jgi:MinD superfamily P-loop ATPase
MIVAIASGKGGTGKTTLAVNLARTFDGEVRLLDCDVEEPNGHLFLRGNRVAAEEVFIPVPRVDEGLCDGCGECGSFCEYGAIVSFGTAPLVFPEMCHGCGGCMKVCPRGAIGEEGRRVGVVETLRADNVTLIQGRLEIGEAMAPPVIRAVKSHLEEGVTAILDAPPGTSCPVITTLRGADYVLLVTEPTPFGLHDLELAVKMVRELGIPFGVVLNRAGAGDDRVNRFCEKYDVPILLEIPDDRRIAEAYSRGDLLVEVLPHCSELFRDLLARLPGLAAGKERVDECVR